MLHVDAQRAAMICWAVGWQAQCHNGRESDRREWRAVEEGEWRAVEEGEWRAVPGSGAVLRSPPAGFWSSVLVGACVTEHLCNGTRALRVSS